MKPSSPEEIAADFYRVGVYDKARDFYLLAIGERSDVAKYHGGLAACYARLGETENAISAFERALELRPDIGSYHAGLATSLIKKANFEDAISHLSIAIERNPNQASWYASLAFALRQSGRNFLALENLKMASSCAPDNAYYHADLAQALSEAGDVSGAISHYELAISHNDKLSHWHTRLAQCLYSIGLFDRALTYIRSSLFLDPENVSLQFQRDKILARTDEFRKVLKEFDSGEERRRIYIAGCGRSGTWLLANMMSCFEDVWQSEKERHYGYFAQILEPVKNHILKRDSESYREVEFIPECVSILYIIRHPFDVLTSKHIDEAYYISPERWRGEILGLQRVRHRPNTIFVRFEDLISQPNTVQFDIEKTWNLKSGVSFDEFHTRAQVTEFVSQSMNGIRKPDISNLERYRKNSDHLNYCRDVAPSLASELLWVSQEFGYQYPDDIMTSIKKHT